MGFERRGYMLPEKVKILGHEYRVEQVEGYLAKTGGNTGQSNNYLNVITIGRELAESTKHEILLHEIIEAVDSRLELNLEHSKICALSEALYQVLKDNPLRF